MTFFRREVGKRIEYGILRHIGLIAEQGYRRLHLPVGDERHESLGLRRSLKQYEVGTDTLKFLQDVPAGARPVMTYSQ